MRRLAPHLGIPVTAVAAIAALAAATIVPLSGAGVSAAQRRTTPARRVVAPPSAPAPSAMKTVTPALVCATPLGTGIATARVFCDVLTGRAPSDGIIVDLPPHVGPVTLRFDLHNRQVFSEEQVAAKRAFARYTASIGALTMDNRLISRAVIQSEFRAASDLFDRVGGGAGPGGLKAVAPTGLERIAIDIPETESRVSILGEKVTVERTGGTKNTYSSAGRPIAIISNLTIEYRDPPVSTAKPATRKPAR